MENDNFKETILELFRAMKDEQPLIKAIDYMIDVNQQGDDPDIVDAKAFVSAYLQNLDRQWCVPPVVCASNLTRQFKQFKKKSYLSIILS